MSRCKKHLFFKIVSTILIITFGLTSIDTSFAQDHPRACPVTIAGILTPDDLAAQSPFQGEMMTDSADRFKQSIFSDIEMLTAVFSVSQYLLGDPEAGLKPLPLNYMESVLVTQNGKPFRNVDLSRATIKDGVVLLPGEKDGTKYVIQIALAGKSPNASMAGYEWMISDKYMVKVLPEGYTEPTAAPAAAPEKITLSEPVAEMDIMQRTSAEEEPSPRKISIRSILGGRMLAVEPFSAALVITLITNFVAEHPVLVAVAGAVVFVIIASMLYRKFHYLLVSPEKCAKDLFSDNAKIRTRAKTDLVKMGRRGGSAVMGIVSRPKVVITMDNVMDNRIEGDSVTAQLAGVPLELVTRVYTTVLDRARIIAMRILVETEHPGAYEAIKKIAGGDYDFNLRAVALYDLGDLKDPRASDLILAALDSPESWLEAHAAAYAAAKLKDKKAVEALFRLAEKGPDMRLMSQIEDDPIDFLVAIDQIAGLENFRDDRTYRLLAGVVTRPDYSKAGRILGRKLCQDDAMKFVDLLKKFIKLPPELERLARKCGKYGIMFRSASNKDEIFFGNPDAAHKYEHNVTEVLLTSLREGEGFRMEVIRVGMSSTYSVHDHDPDGSGMTVDEPYVIRIISPAFEKEQERKQLQGAAEAKAAEERVAVEAKAAEEQAAAEREARSNEAAMLGRPFNSLRGEFIGAANVLAASCGVKDMPMNSAMSSLEIRTGAAAYLDRAVNSAGGIASVPDNVKKAAETIATKQIGLEVNSLIAAIIALAAKAWKDDQYILIGVETGWLPGLVDKSDPRHASFIALEKQLLSLGDTLRLLGLHNVVVVSGEGDRNLALAMAAEEGKKRIKYENMVCLATEETITKSDYFNFYRSTPTEKRAFLAGINTSAIKETLKGEDGSKKAFIDIMELLTLTLELAAGKEPPKDNPLIASYDKALRILILLPRPEIMDYEKIIQIYNTQRRILEAA